MAIPPTEGVRLAASLLAPGNALDVACGAGRHAIWLHQQGWHVDAVDRDREAIAQIRASHPAIAASVIDLEQEPFPIPDNAFDLIVCWLYFQRDLYPKLRAGVRPGGLAALSVRRQGRFAAKTGELRSLFPGWIVHREVEAEQTYELVIERPTGSLLFSGT